MNAEDLNSINARTVPLPEIPQAVGELVAELMAENPDAVVIDRASRQVIVYPSGSASERPELSASSITALLSEYAVYMIDEGEKSAAALLASEDASTHVALFCHPSQYKDLQCHAQTQSLKLPIYQTRVVSPHFLLLCCRESLSSYKLKGMTLSS